MLSHALNTNTMSMKFHIRIKYVHGETVKIFKHVCKLLYGYTKIKLSTSCYSLMAMREYVIFQWIISKVKV